MDSGQQEPATISEGEGMAQTAQAKELRDAHAKLAQRARAYADRKDLKRLEGMGLPKDRAKAIIDGAQFTLEDFARLLGKELKTMQGWLAQDGAAHHRDMDETAKLLLERILADK